MLAPNVAYLQSALRQVDRNRSSRGHPQFIKQAEHAENALRRANGDHKEASRLLEIHPKSFWRLKNKSRGHSPKDGSHEFLSSMGLLSVDDLVLEEVACGSRHESGRIE